jgi:UDP-glucuronate 4-epimerase
LAAQAGVRYSLINPRKYIDVNIYGFINIINCIKHFKVDKFIYASSSSVYGESKKFPLLEDNKVNPKNIYGYSKLINEKIAEYFFKNNNIPSIGLRFFTVFGPWGRPDMFILKLLTLNKKKNFFQLNNSGNHYRDFTSINDINIILEKLCKKKITRNYIFNVCSNRPIYIKTLVKMIEKYKGKLKIKNIPKNKADVYKTHGNNRKILNYLKINKFSNFEVELKKTIDWFNNQNII